MLWCWRGTCDVTTTEFLQPRVGVILEARLKVLAATIRNGLRVEIVSSVVGKSENGRQVDLTQLLFQAKNGDETARADIIRAAYEDLRRIAQAQMRHQRQDHTLSSTALVHEVAIRFLKNGRVAPENRVEFLAYASTAMRRILVDHARAQGKPSLRWWKSWRYHTA